MWTECFRTCFTQELKFKHIEMWHFHTRIWSTCEKAQMNLCNSHLETCQFHIFPLNRRSKNFGHWWRCWNWFNSESLLTSVAVFYWGLQFRHSTGKSWHFLKPSWLRNRIQSVQRRDSGCEATLCRCRLNIFHAVITSVETLWAVKQFCRRRCCAVTCSTSCKRPGVTSVETPVSESVPPCEDYYSTSIEAAARSDPRSKPPSRRLSANTLHLQPTSDPHMLPAQKQPEALWAPSQSFNKQSDCVPVEAQTRLQGMFDTRLHRVSKCS